MALNLIPQPGQTLLATRNPILQNWVTINAGFLQDHVEFGIAGAGKHKTLHLVNQTNAPAAPVTVAGEVGLYSAPGYPNNGAPALYFKTENSGAAVDGIDFTTSTNATRGWCRLPCGILLKWGSKSVTGNEDTVGAAVTETFDVAANIPPFVAIYNVMLTPGSPTSGDNPSNIQFALSTKTTVNFTVGIRKITGAGNNVTAPVYYLAIGV